MRLFAETLDLQQATGAKSRANFLGPIIATGTFRGPALPGRRPNLETRVGAATFGPTIGENFAFRSDLQPLEPPGAGIERVAGG